MGAKIKTQDIIIPLATLFSVAVFPFLFFQFVFFQRILPNTYLANINLGGLTTLEARKRIEEKVKIPDKIEIKGENQTIYVYINQIKLDFDFQKTAESAYSQKSNISILEQPLFLFRKTNIHPRFSYDNTELEEALDEASKRIEQKGTKPKAEIINKKVVITNGKPGINFEKEKIKKELDNKFLALDFSPIKLEAVSDKFVLSQEEEELYRKRVENILNKKLVLSYENYSKEVPDTEIAQMTDFFEEYDKQKISNLAGKVKNELDSSPENPIFVFEDGIVKEFRPAKYGVTVNQTELTEMILESLKNLEKENKENSYKIEIPVAKTPPEYETKDVNNLGIKELIGTGKSKFVGSIPSRIHNIKLASSKFNGVLIKPDEVFSFNKTLGEVSKETGYQQAYIIKEGQTVLGDGGGVCQVSTTLFRAALNAGLPIIERQAHAYRVNYYEQDSPPGLDATVFDPSPDLKFKNDTGNHILIQVKVDTNAKTLAFELYGTKDDRKVYISKPIVTNITPPPEDLYIDDPTLPAGQIKQIDWKAWGAKVWFDYKVTRGEDELFSKRFYSNYRPWQAKFLRGTKI